MGGLGCVLKHTVIPAMGAIKGMIVEFSRRALGVAKTRLDFLSQKAVAFVSLGLKSLKQKFPALDVGTKLAVDAVNRLAIPEYAD